MATLIRSDAKLPTEEVSPKTLEEMQALVGGLIEFVTFENGSALMVNEEGLLRELPHNFRATVLCEQHGRPSPIVLVGDAVFFSRDEMRAMEGGEEEEGA